MNKEDLFRQKLETGKSIKVAFPEYDGPNDFESSTRFLEKTFTNVIDPTTGQPKEIYTHITCATNTDNVRVVFDAVRDFIINKALQISGLVSY